MKNFRIAISFLTLFSLSLSVAFGARGSVQVQGDASGGYPDANWEGSKAFRESHDFSFGGGSGPKIYVGHSVGGNHTYGAAASNASSTLCATPVGWKHDEPSSKLKDVPVFTITGDGDFGQYDIDMAQKANAQGGRESVAWHRGHGHNYSDPELVYIFWAESIRLRYPSGSSLRNTPRENGWLGDMSKASWESECPYIAPFKEYKRDKSKAAWFPTRYFAFCWRAYVLGKGRFETSPIIVTTPRKGGSWSGWPKHKAGDMVKIQALVSGKGESKVVIYYGDNVIKSIPRIPGGVYQAEWKAVAGIQGIVVVAYNQDNVPIATSRLVPVIVSGRASYSAVDNASIENTSSVPTVVWSPKQDDASARTGKSRAYWDGEGINLFFVNGRQAIRPGSRKIFDSKHISSHALISLPD